VQAEASINLCADYGLEKTKSVNCDKDATVCIPFHLNHDVPIVELSVNGHKREPFILDSGSATTYLSDSEAGRLGLSLNPTPELSPGSGDNSGMSTSVVKGIKLTFSKWIIFQGAIPALDLTALDKSLGCRISGVVGYDILRSHVTKVDYYRHTFEIFQGSAPQPEVDTQRITLMIDSNEASYPTVLCPVVVAGRSLGSARIMIDTGFQRELLFTSLFARGNGFEAMDGWKFQSGAGIGGGFTEMYGLHGQIRLSTKTLPVSVVSAAKVEQGMLVGKHFDGIIGTGLLSRFSITFDAKRGLLFMDKVSD
jgi:hypothetical protein